MREAIILAGGFGKRLREVVSDLPKPMASVGGRPFLEIILNTLAQRGFKRIILSLGYMADKIVDYFGDRFADMDIVYVIEKSPLGTGGAVKLAMEASCQDCVFIFNGDSFLDLEVDNVESLWKINKRPIIIGCKVEDTMRYGRLLIDKGRIVGFAEKGISGAGVINAGCYVLNQGQLQNFSDGLAFSIEKDFFPKMIEQDKIDLFVSSGYFIDIGVPEDYVRAQLKFC